ncbi:hypothetical protein [Dokdonia sp. R86516]|uniref:hypothetical protein n=1 Tax=Dokdonia sp. R86516 TaxID=3093856 RepID=UPI0037C642D8
MRLPLYGLVLGISTLGVLYTKSIDQGFRFKLLPVIIYFFFLATTILIQTVNGTLSVFILMLIAGPSLAYFVYNNKFSTRIIKIPILIFGFYFMAFYVLKGTLEGAFLQMSVNYVSVVMIMNTVLIGYVESNQKVKLSLWPSLIGLFLALIAQGRAGIIITFLLVINVLFVRWRLLTTSTKIISGFALFALLALFIISQLDTIILIFENFTLLERFTERGIDSPSRDILKNEYLAHMNTKNLILGYNYTDNPWFKHYGGNPHNSYIRLHHFFGALFFVIIPLLIVALFKILKRSYFLFLLFFAVLLRAYTDTVLFLTLYDFIIILFVMWAYGKAQANKLTESL